MISAPTAVNICAISKASCGVTPSFSIQSVAETRTDIGLALIETLIVALDATQPPEQRADPAMVHEKIVSTRADTLVEGVELWRSAMLYTYRSLPISGLRELLAFAESDAGRWYHETVWKSSTEALAAISIETQAVIAARISQPTPDAP